MQSSFDQGAPGHQHVSLYPVTQLTRMSTSSQRHALATLGTSRMPGSRAATCQLVRRTVTVAATVGVLAAIATPSMKTAVAEGPLHHIRYTVTTETAWHADIYYRDTDPPDFAAYSHNPYQFSPKVDADLGPRHVWTLDVMLNNPAQWAIVFATSGADPVTPRFHCTLEVDGAVAATSQGPKGAMCSMRTW